MSESITYDPKLEALKIILDARRHEIDLVWKRGLFFWGFVALAAAGTGHALVEWDARQYLAMVTSGLGAAASFASYLAAKGSKRWQEIWELRAEIAEADVIGRLFDSSHNIDQLKEYRNEVRIRHGDFNPEKNNDKNKIKIICSKNFSVSKLHILLNLTSTTIFFIIFIIVCFCWGYIDFRNNIDIRKMFAIGGSAFLLAIFFCLAYGCCRSSPGPANRMKLL